MCAALLQVRRVLVHNPPAVVTPAKEPGSAPITTGRAQSEPDVCDVMLCWVVLCCVV